MLYICQAGFEGLMEEELKLEGISALERGPGWIVEAAPSPLGTSLGSASPKAAGAPLPPSFAFPHLILESPVEIKADSVNALADQILAWFTTSLQGERIDAPYPSFWDGPAELVGLGRRIRAVEDAWAGALKKRLSRVAKLALRDLPRGVGPARGIFVWFVDFQRAFVARSAWRNGQRRMADNPDAPSRSYLKVEEAYGILGREPAPGETVADLGAAPGGWSFSAARRGATVIAVDNGPLKGGALDNPLIEHRQADAFRFHPEAGRRFDWLFCDLLEEPHQVGANLIRPWLERRWCSAFVVNLKFGRVDAVALLRELRGPGSPFAGAGNCRIRHLYHDREEFTVTGEAAPDYPARPRSSD